MVFNSIIPSFTPRKMKKRTKIKAFQQIIVVLITIITLIGVSSSYAVQNDLKSFTEIVNDQESADQQEDSPSPEFTLVSFQAIINFVQFDLHFESYLIQELIQVDTIVHYLELESPTYCSDYFEKLIGLIISPNAP